jgi:hypothetical protein
MPSRIAALAIDCHDPQRLAAFWTAVLGYEIVEVDVDGVSIAAPDGSGVTLDLLVVPDDKVVKNRLHLDLRPDDRDSEVERVLALGATRVDVGQGPEVTWVVLADPEGNEFCILRALPDGDQT